jgi:hypothetical protein
MIDRLFSSETAVPCDFARPYHLQINQLAVLVSAQKTALIDEYPGGYDHYYNLVGRFSAEVIAQDWPDLVAFVASIESRAAEIVSIRTCLYDTKVAAMVEKIRHLALDSEHHIAVDHEGVVRKAMADFAAFDDWRAASLDGVKSKMLFTLFYRDVATSPRSKDYGMFDQVFAQWAKAVGMDKRQAVNILTASDEFTRTFHEHLDASAKIGVPIAPYMSFHR